MEPLWSPWLQPVATRRKPQRLRNCGVPKLGSHLWIWLICRQDRGFGTPQGPPCRKGSPSPRGQGERAVDQPVGGKSGGMLPGRLPGGVGEVGALPRLRSEPRRFPGILVVDPERERDLPLGELLSGRNTLEAPSTSTSQSPSDRCRTSSTEPAGERPLKSGTGSGVAARRAPASPHGESAARPRGPPRRRQTLRAAARSAPLAFRDGCAGCRERFPPRPPSCARCARGGSRRRSSRVGRAQLRASASSALVPQRARLTA